MHASASADARFCETAEQSGLNGPCQAALLPSAGRPKNRLAPPWRCEAPTGGSLFQTPQGVGGCPRAILTGCDAHEPPSCA